MDGFSKETPTLGYLQRFPNKKCYILLCINITYISANVTDEAITLWPTECFYIKRMSYTLHKTTTNRKFLNLTFTIFIRVNSQYV